MSIWALPFNSEACYYKHPFQIWTTLFKYEPPVQRVAYDRPIVWRMLPSVLVVHIWNEWFIFGMGACTKVPPYTASPRHCLIHRAVACWLHDIVGDTPTAWTIDADRWVHRWSIILQYKLAFLFSARNSRVYSRYSNFWKHSSYVYKAVRVYFNVWILCLSKRTRNFFNSCWRQRRVADSYHSIFCWFVYSVRILTYLKCLSRVNRLCVAD